MAKDKRMAMSMWRAALIIRKPNYCVYKMTMRAYATRQLERSGK